MHVLIGFRLGMWQGVYCLTYLTENGVPPSGNTRAVVGQSVAGRAPGVVRSKWRE